MFWVMIALICSLAAVVMWFGSRWLNKSDEFQKGITGTLSQHESSMGDLNVKLATTAADMARSNLEFQQSVSHELVNIKKSTLEIESSLQRTSDLARDVDAKLDGTLQKVNHLDQKVDFHSKALDDVGALLKDHANDIRENDTNIQSVVRDLRAMRKNKA